jgi:hypothetical protein
MKFSTISLTFAAALAFGLASCSKNEPVTLTTDDANKAVGSAADTLTNIAEGTKAEAAKTAEAAKAEATKPAEAADNTKAQESIDKAKSLVAENKFADASSVLQQLAGQTLSSDQMKVVDALKEQIQKALAAKAGENAAGAAGNLLKK